MFKINKKVHSKIVDSIKFMVSRYEYQFWGEFALNINYEESESIRTAGVRFSDIHMEFIYNPKFLEENVKNIYEMNGLMLHEELHLLCEHGLRTKLGNYNHSKSNVIQDMIINTSIKNLNFKDIQMPISDKIYYIPPEYTGKHIFENLYAWLVEKKEERDFKNKKQNRDFNQNSGNSDSSGKRDDSKNNGENDYDKRNWNPEFSDELNKGLDAFDDSEYQGIDVHLSDNCPDDIKEEIIKNIKNSLKIRGILSSDIEGLLNRLNPPKKNYLKLIAKEIDMIKGGQKYETITRPNRRGISGLKGKRNIGNALNCVLDVSGSMNGYLEKVISYIFMNEYFINLIQCDAKVQKHCVINRKDDLVKMKIKGYGGTVLQHAIDYCVEKLPKFSILVLTDGYTDTLNFGNNKGLVISCGIKPNVIGKNVKTILIEENI